MRGDGRAQPGVVANRTKPVAAAIEVDALEPGHRRCAATMGRRHSRSMLQRVQGATAIVLAWAAGEAHIVASADEAGGMSRRAAATAIGGSLCLRSGIRFDQRDNLREGRDGDQPPLLEMVRQCDRDQKCEQRSDAQIPSPTSPLLRIGIDESIRRCAAETQHVTVREPLRPANPPTIDERARPGLEIDDVVAAALISDDRMALVDVRIRDPQSRTFGAADPSFTTREQQQPSATAPRDPRRADARLAAFSALAATLARGAQDGRHSEDERGSF